MGQQLSERVEVPFYVEAARVPGRVPVRMDVHPLRADISKFVKTTAQLRHCSFPDFWNRTCHREIPCRMPDHLHSMSLKGRTNCFRVDIPRCRSRGL